MVTKKQLDLYLGETFKHRFYYRDEAGIPIDLTNCDARMEVRSTLDPTKVYLVLSTDPGNARLAINGPIGEVELTIPATDTTPSKIKWDEGDYDVKVVFSDGITVDTVARGKIVVERGVTQGVP